MAIFAKYSAKSMFFRVDLAEYRRLYRDARPCVFTQIRPRISISRS